MTTVDRAPLAVIIAGPNGAGKSSAAPELLQGAYGVNAFVNADVIAQGLSGFRPDAAAVEAGRIMLRRLDELATRREDFAFETTLSGRALLGQITGWRASGYEVHLLYLWLPSADLAVRRVRRRVEAGGHDVPEQVIRRRFGRSLANFGQHYQRAVTSWRVYDSSAPDVRPLVAYATAEQGVTVVDAARWETIRTQVETPLED